ncbi:CdaR family protein [Vagococcus vulneris]|uniref:YbbR-like protein n=1 Tax=Vagococcus vulneris TaxID=1977869 RepID=A0A429ZZM6_9ENTE|nr:CdaR family protein [Vagococcus vulneris]RST99508.1 hypothetical protein CBF37_04065 [Vagococcus vulneris]
MDSNERMPWLLKLLALFFALLLYFNANTPNGGTEQTTGLNDLEATAINVPVNVTYNQDKYFISGYDKTVSVKLSSANKILLDKESNSETRSFSVVMDLTNYKEGTYEVPLEVVSKPASIKAKVSPEKVHVTIEKRKQNTFQVEPAIDGNIFAQGYEKQEAKAEPPIVEISAGNNAINQIDRVIAGVSDKQDVSSDFTESVKLYAINKKGETLDVQIKPETVKVSVTVTAPKKKVKVNPVQTGTIPQGIKDYTFSIKNSEVEIEGPRAVLDEISGIDLKIDTSNIRDTLRSSYVVVVPKDIKVNPETVFVTVIPNKQDSDKPEHSSSEKKEDSSSKDK